ncbi:hypothetical protein MJ8_34850 [Mesorhizobium sp. J8]|nr:hypothetical protein MJ8_34850 [Mesorhizobium sp. J8]
MDDFKPFCLADNMARWANLSEFLNRECSKAHRVAVAHEKTRPRHRDRVLSAGRLAVSGVMGRNYFALATTDSKGL